MTAEEVRVVCEELMHAVARSGAVKGIYVAVQLSDATTLETMMLARDGSMVCQVRDLINASSLVATTLEKKNYGPTLPDPVQS